MEDDRIKHSKEERLGFCLEFRKRFPETPHIYSEISDWVVLNGDNIFIEKDVRFLDRGFGYCWDPKTKKYLHIPHIGNVIIDDNVEIHSGAMIDRGTVNSTTIGYGTKIDRDVHIAHNSSIGHHCLLISKVLVCGSVIIGSKCKIGAGAIINDHVQIADGTYVGSGSVVTKNISMPHQVWARVPARFIRKRREDDY